MNKAQVRRIERKARRLMRLDDKIWRKHGWTNGDMVDKAVYTNEISKSVRPNSLNRFYYYIFEDANFHTLNATLEKIGAFKKAIGEDDKSFEAYRKAGGKTWRLT